MVITLCVFEEELSMQTVFVHPEQCIGCKQCEVACAVAHSQSKNVFLSVFELPSPKPRIHAEPGLTYNTAFPNKCRHCDPAPCISACPTRALYRAADHPDIVLLDGRKCIACGMCAMVCPFDAITYYADVAAPDKTVVAIKCDHCIERQRVGEIPACVEACKVGALQFGEINELVKASRTRYAQRVTAVVSQVEAEPAALPVSVDNLRQWGTAVTALNANGHRETRGG
jgi:carbon-monoxide dehydrogenase iron sulfur subunit